MLQKPFPKLFSKAPLVIVLFLVFVTPACSNRESRQEDGMSTIVSDSVNNNTFYQYNIWAAFVNRVFDGSLTVSDLKQKGDVGLGSFDMLDGEMVMLDGVPYRVREDGTVSEGADNDELVYADATFFHADENFSFNNLLHLDSLKLALNAKLPSPNNFYAVKVTGTFDRLKLGGVPKQSAPFNTGLDVLIPQRPVFIGEKIRGTMVGFYCPQFIGDINTVGYHFHFISDDRKMGGHVMEIESVATVQVTLDKLTTYEFQMPESAAFDTVKFDKQFQYNTSQSSVPPKASK